ncbi:MAG: hypothetical protein M3N28_02255 [Actinomycetota bacterium]|nr:hypothetical protein [Actinomycetota bacterium]
MSRRSKAKGKAKSKGKGDGRAFRLLSRLGISRGLMGGSRAWTIVAVFTIAVRLLKRVFGGTPDTVYSETLGPGDCLVIAHDREARVVKAPS